MKIKIRGREFEAYKLVMTKENALAILKGKKRVEVRTFSDYYIKMFLNKKVRAKQEEEIKAGREVDIRDAIKMTEFVRFTNYNMTWHVDVHLEELGIITVSKEDVEGLAEDYNFHELDDEVSKYEDLPDEDKPLVFVLAIDQVVDSSGI